MKKIHFKKYIAPYASSDNQFRRDPNFQIFIHRILDSIHTCMYVAKGQIYSVKTVSFALVKTMLISRRRKSSLRILLLVVVFTSVFIFHFIFVQIYSIFERLWKTFSNKNQFTAPIKLHLENLKDHILKKKSFSKNQTHFKKCLVLNGHRWRLQPTVSKPCYVTVESVLYYSHQGWVWTYGVNWDSGLGPEVSIQSRWYDQSLLTSFKFQLLRSKLNSFIYSINQSFTHSFIH